MNVSLYSKAHYEKYKILYSIFGILVVCAVLFYNFYSNFQTEKAINGVITKGQVYENFDYSRGRSGLRYSFSVKNKIYKESVVFNDAQKVPLGDSIYISYELENPENSIPVFDSLHLNDE